MDIKWIARPAGIFLFLLAAPAFAWRCDHGFVEPGDTAQSVLKKCGRPDFVYGGSGGTAYKRSAVLWYYDSGPTQLVRVLRLRGGVLEDMDTAGYGLRELAGGCTPADIRIGMHVYELVKRCGKPWRKRGLGKRAAGYAEGRTEIWTYDLGSRYLLQKVTLVNGQVRSTGTMSRSQRLGKAQR